VDEAQLERQLADVFFVESGEMLSEASLALLRAEEAGDPQESINQVFRAIHSIKGGSQSLGFDQLSEVAHRMENFLVPLRQVNCTIDGQAVSLILEAMDVIEMQLSAYQAGELPTECNQLLVKLDDITVLAKSAETIPVQTVADSQEIVVNDHGSRLLYVSFTVDTTAPMPGVTAVILLEQLRQSGQVLYCHPNMDDLGMTVVGEYFNQTVIFQTDMSNAAIKQAAYNVTDIQNIKVADIDNDIFSNADMPAEGEIDRFNTLVGEMQEGLCCKQTDKAYLDKLVKQIVEWGRDSRGAAGWFPGGLSAWQRITSLLIVPENVEFSCETDRTLQVVWEAAYNALCNHTYFYSVPIHNILDGNEQQVIEQLETSGVDIRVVIIDLSHLMTLEGSYLRTLVDFRDKLAKKDWAVGLISEGHYTRRHLNVLEASENLVGTLKLYSSSYHAVIALMKIGLVGADRHVSKN
jgi:HPt (histidine-containing phosphotransfer) domain-containing protein/anti-anti-sigma regulatory factor